MNEIFENLGVSDRDARAFLKMMELGAQPISVIAKHVGVPRTTMYTIIDTLKGLNLIEEFERMGIKYVKCIPASQIRNLLNAREKGIQSALSLLEENLPKLEAMENRLSITPQVRFFEGKEAVKTMYESVLKEKEFLAFFNPQLVKSVMPEYHFVIPETLRKNKIQAKEMLVDCPDAHAYKNLYCNNRHQIKLLKNGISFSADTIVGAEKIYMVTFGPNEISSIEIRNSVLAHALRVMLEELWKSIE